MNKQISKRKNKGSYFTPADVVKLLIGLTNLQADEKVLAIGLNPHVLLPEIESKTGREPMLVQNDIRFEELDFYKDSKFVVIVCGPIFGVRSPSEQYETNDEFWVRWGLEHLGEKRRFSIILPMGFLTNYKQQETRELVLQKSKIETIIQIPSGWSKGSMISAGIFILSNALLDQGQEIKMMELIDASSPDWASIQKELLSPDPDYSSIKSVHYFTVPYSKITSERLGANYYEPKYEQFPNPNPDTYKEYDLGDLVEIRSGERLAKEKLVSSGIPFIQVGNVDFNGHINPGSSRFIKRIAAQESRSFCIPNDIVITTAGTIGKVALIGKRNHPNGVMVDTATVQLTGWTE